MKVRQGAVAAFAAAAVIVMTGGVASAATAPAPVPSVSPAPSTSPSPSPSPSAPASPSAVTPAASGPGSFENMCLANSDAWCTSIDPVEIYMAVIGTPPALKMIWDWITQQREKGAPSGPEGEEQSQGDDGGNDAGQESTGLCLASTGGTAYMTNCGAPGTVWIAEQHNDGWRLASRWMWNTYGINEVLTAPLDQNADLFVELPSSAWQTWGWYVPPAGTCCNY
jgi:hypothetical protein